MQPKRPLLKLSVLATSFGRCLVGLFRLCFSRRKLRNSFLALSFVSGASVCSAQSLQFHPASPVNTSLPPLYVLTADLNNDGFQDLLVVTNESQGLPSSLNVFLGNGDGTFKPGTSYVLGTAGSSSPGPPLLGQIRLTGPNLWDVIIPMTAANSVNVLLGNGDGTFQAAKSYPTNPAPTAVALGQFNFDTLADLVVTSEGASSGSSSGSSVSVLPGHSDGTFGAPLVTSITEAQPSSVVWADFNKDFNLDVAVGSANGIRILLSTAEGVFQTGANYPLSSPVKALLVADFNNDSSPDLVAIHGNAVSVLLGVGDGTFQGPTDFNVGNGANAAVVLDFNGDGKLDLVVSNNADNTFCILLGNGDGTFQPPMTFSSPGLGPTSIQSAGFNNDGAPDIAIATSSGATAGTPGSTYILLNSRGVRGTMSPSLNPVELGAPVTFTANLTPTFPGLPTPTGQVAFYFDSFLIGNSIVDATGSAQITTNMGFTLPNTIRASYSGDKNYDGVGLPPFVEGIVDLNVTQVSPSPVTVAAGDTANFTLSVALQGTFNSPINFSCSGAPPNSSCSISPSSVPAGTNSTTTVTLSVRTSGPHMANADGISHTDQILRSGLVGLGSLVVLMLACFAASPRAIPRCSWGMLAATLLATCLGGCGGGSGAPPQGTVTPAGTYTLTFTANSATANITQSQQLKLTVTN